MVRIMSISETVGRDTQTILKDEQAIDSRLDEILASYRGDKSELVSILQHVQHEMGYLAEDVLNRIARFVDAPASTVFGVATFYTQLKLRPVGKNIIKVCRGTGCYVKGAPQILTELEKHLGIQDGETTEDMEFTLETVACFGACALAPVMVINDKVYGKMTVDKVKQILDTYKEKKPNEK
jgi:NADH-quinone oxidoreductase subunit E